MADKSKNTLNLTMITKYFKSKKGTKALFIIGIVGIVLIGVSSFLPKKKDAVSDTGRTEKTVEQYTVEIEEKVLDIISSIDGVGRGKVMVTLENGVQNIYATEKRKNSDVQQDEYSKSERDDSQDSIIIIDRGNGKEGLIVTEIQPTIKGVVVICEGGDLEVVKKRVTDMLTTAFNISAKRVCVTKISS